VTTAHATAEGSWRTRLQGLGPLVLLALVACVGLRLALPGHIHYLGDEDWTFQRVREALRGDGWAPLGMPSSRGLRNAGMSVWVFIVLGALGHVETPVGLTRAVAVLAIVAHALLLVVPLRLLRDERERRAWIWAFVLTATNPILVFLERNIWAQSVLPIFQVLIIVSFWKRSTRAGAFAWGLVGAVVGQIHMAGFFFVPALAVFTRALEPKERRARWGWWLAGSVVGALPAVPWLLYMARERPPAAAGSPWLRFRLEFYQYFFSDPSGLSSEYVIGRDVLPLMRYPLVAGHATYLVGAAHVVLAVATLAVAKRVLVHAWRRRTALGELLFGDRSDTAILLAATLLGMGALMTLPSIPIHRHYMMALFPVPYVWTARAALREPGGERWLAALFGGAFVVSLGILSFLHANGGADGFGKAWVVQAQEGANADGAKELHP